jgi:hypothetical protein
MLLTEFVEKLKETCPAPIIEAYRHAIPEWRSEIEAGINAVILEHGHFPVENQLAGIYFYRVKFLLSLSQTLIEKDSRFLGMAARVDPYYFALDSWYQFLCGNDPEAIAERHFEGLKAWYWSLNITGNYMEAVKKELVGEQVAKAVLGFRSTDLKKLHRLCRGQPEDYVHQALCELLGDVNPVKVSDMPSIKSALEGDPNEEQLKRILDNFGRDVANLEKAISGKFRILKERAKNRRIDSDRKAERDKHGIESVTFEWSEELSAGADSGRDPMAEHDFYLDIERIRPGLDADTNVILQKILEGTLTVKGLHKVTGKSEYTVRESLKILKKRVKSLF